MSFQSLDLSGLANLLRQSDPSQVDSDDSDDDEYRERRLPSFGPGQIGTKTAEKGAGDASTSSCQKSGQSASKKDTAIWDSKEVTENQSQASIPNTNDPRKTPKYEMYYRQAVTSEDIFLQMGNKTPSSASCENLVVEIYLPDEEDFNKIQLNLKEQAIDLRSPNHFLYLGLPHPIDTKAGNAKWDQLDEKLIVTLQLARELDRLNF